MSDTPIPPKQEWKFTTTNAPMSDTQEDAETQIASVQRTLDSYGYDSRRRCGEITDGRLLRLQRAIDRLAAYIARLEATPAGTIRPCITAWAALMEQRMRMGDERGWTLTTTDVNDLTSRALDNAQRYVNDTADVTDAVDACNLLMLTEACIDKTSIARLEAMPADPMAEAYLAPERIAAQAEWAVTEATLWKHGCDWANQCIIERDAKYDRLLVAARINAADRTRLAATSLKHRRKQLTVVEAGSFKNLCAVIAEAKGETP